MWSFTVEAAAAAAAHVDTCGCCASPAPPAAVGDTAAAAAAVCPLSLLPLLLLKVCVGVPWLLLTAPGPGLVQELRRRPPVPVCMGRRRGRGPLLIAAAAAIEASACVSACHVSSPRTAVLWQLSHKTPTRAAVMIHSGSMSFRTAPTATPSSRPGVSSRMRSRLTSGCCFCSKLC